MARRRYYYRFKTTKPKYSINAVDLNASVATQQSGRSLQFYSNICTNTGNNASAVPIMKTARFKVKGVIQPYEDDDEKNIFPSGSSLVMAIMYLPEGLVPDTTPYNNYDISNYLFYRHQEWVMGWIRMDYISLSQKNEFSITSRLKRNLNKGDTVALVCFLQNANSALATPQFNIRASATYACRAN